MWSRFKRSLPWALVLVLALTSVAVLNWPCEPESEAVFRPGDWPATVDTPHFRVYYDKWGNRAVDPEFAQQVGTALEDAYRRLQGAAPFPALQPRPFPVRAEAASDPLGDHEEVDGPYKMHIGIYTSAADSPDATLETVAAHELVHALQAQMWGRMQGPDRAWLTEGTAQAVEYLLFEHEPEVRDRILWGTFSDYWYTHNSGLLEQDYSAGLFWYDLARRYGGMEFIYRLLHWSASYDPFTATQLAAIQGGAPESATFAHLYRQFVLGLVTGELALPYPEWEDGPDGTLWVDHVLRWRGETRAQAVSPQLAAGLDYEGRLYTYETRLRVPPFAFEWIELTPLVETPLRLEFAAEPGMEIFVTRAGPGHPEQVVHAGPGAAVHLAVVSDQPLYVAVVRTSLHGTGDYSLHLGPAPANSVMDLPAPAALVAEVAGSSPTGLLMADALAALRSGQLEARSELLASDRPALVFAAGERSVLRPDGVYDATVRPYFAEEVPEDAGDGELMVAAADLALAGFAVTTDGQTATIRAGDLGVAIRAGEAEARDPSGDTWKLRVPPEQRDGHLMVPLSLIMFLGWDVGYLNGNAEVDHYRIIYPL